MNNCFDCYLHNNKPVCFTHKNFCCDSCKCVLQEEMWYTHLFLYNMIQALNNNCTETITKDSVNRLFFLYTQMRKSIRDMDNLLKNGFTKRPFEGREGVFEYFIDKELRGN